MYDSLKNLYLFPFEYLVLMFIFGKSEYTCFKQFTASETISLEGFFFVINSTILIIYSKTEASFFPSALFSRFASHSMECELADNFHCCCAWLENGLLIHIHVLDCVVCLIFIYLLLRCCRLFGSHQFSWVKNSFSSGLTFLL